jgi:competence protein ComEC
VAFYKFPRHFSVLLNRDKRKRWVDMVSIAFGFLLGVVILQQSVSLPPSVWSLALVFCLPALFLFWKYRFFWALCIGFFYALIPSEQRLEARIMPQLEGNDLIVRGSIQSIPDKRGKDWRFQLQINEAKAANKLLDASALKGLIKLNWYRGKQTLHAGEKWQLRVRLKQPNGFSNPHGFDYEKWLFHQGIIATGYVRSSTENKKIADASVYSINALREKILTRIEAVLGDNSVLGVLSALSVAERRDISDVQWLLFRQTGTNHLIAISGLHIGMVAGFGFFPIVLIWWLFPALYLRLPVRIAGGMVGALFAISYALLAGFSLPTQRALIMVLLVLFGLLVKRHYSGTTLLSFAMMLVLLFDPLATLSSGFWLSFLAVGLILWFVSRRLKQPRFAILGVQFALSIGMLPLTLALFGSSSLSAPLANLIAIPWVSIVVVPLTLLSIAMLFVFPVVGEWLLHFATGSVELLLQGLSYLVHPALMLHMPEVPAELLFLAFIGFLWLWFPAGFPARWLGGVLLLPAILYQPKMIEKNAFHYHLLDVGQGLASIIQTRHHILIYDTGPRVGTSFDTGKLVVVPFLQAQGIKHIDTMMVSHGDIDHRGGANYIAAHITIDKVISSEIMLLSQQLQRPVIACEQGLKWVWDGVLFEVLHPTKKWRKNMRHSDNNKSCVLRVSNEYHHLLLTGDIQKEAETSLLKQSHDQLKADVMLIPHHGSKTSSQQMFIDAVQPQLALAGTGYRNRFGFPKKRVVERYYKKNIKVLHTANEGAISLYFSANSGEYKVISSRKKQRQYWSRENPK